MEDIKKFALGSFIGVFGFVLWTKLLHVLIYWDKYIGGPFIADPDGGWLVELFAKYIGWNLDGLIGFTFFTPIIEWVTGGLTFISIYILAFMCLSYILAARHLPAKTGIPIFIVSVIFFMVVYYFHALDHIEFFYYVLSMADTDSSFIKSYVWVGMALAVWIECTKMKDNY